MFFKPRFGSYLVAFVFLFSALPAFSQKTSHNGYWWKDLERHAKITYVIGFADGAAGADSFWAYFQKQAKTKLPASDIKAARSHNDYSNVTYGQLADGLDEFYKDFKNTQIHAFEAIYVVKEQVKGTDQKALDDYILFLRKDASEPDYDKN